MLLIKKFKCSRVSFSVYRRYCQAVFNEFTIRKLQQFGTLNVQCPNSNIKIRNIDPHVHRDGDIAILKFLSNKTYAKDSYKWFYDSQDSKLSLNETSNPIEKMFVELEIPHNFDINVCGNDITITETEGENINVESYGNCTLGKIKSFSTNFKVNGYLQCKSLHGNGKIDARGNVNIQKLQTEKCSVHTKHSNIDIQNIYSREFQGDSITGNISIGSLHGKGVLKSDNGHVSLKAMSGDLDIRTIDGNIDVSFNNFEKSSIVSESGNIDIGFSEMISAYVNVSACYIDVPETLLFDGMKRSSDDDRQHFEGKISDGKADISIETGRGTICFSQKEWISKFNIDMLE